MNPAIEERNARQIGLGSAVALVVASMIGAGIFTTTGFLISDLKSPWLVLGAWVVGGIIACLGALSYGALARRIPESGGEYIFLSRTLHPSAGYLAGWISLLVGFSAPMAAAAFGFGKYIQPWTSGLDPRMSGTIIILIFSVVHAAHVQRGTRVQDLVVLAKVILILLLIGYGVTHLPQQNWPVQEGFPASAFAVSLVWISFSYSGWNAAIYIGGEVRDAERNLPRAMLWGTILVAIIYVALNVVFLAAVPASALAGQLEVGRIAAEALGGRTLASLVIALIAVALVTSVSSMIMTGPRVYARMAQDGYLPRWLAGGYGPPRVAIVFQTALGLIMLWTTTYDRLLTAIGFTLSLSTAATVAGLVRLRLREGERLAVPGWPWVPLLFLLGVLWMMAFTIWLRPIESLYGLAVLIIGWLAWWRQSAR